MESIRDLTVPCRPITQGPQHHFFGYYEKSPWDPSGRYVLAMEVDFNEREPGPNDVARIGLVDTHEHDQFMPITETRAWNWQQGAMAQWVMDRQIIYNDRHPDGFSAVLFDIFSQERRVLPLPIYTLHPNGQSALGIDFGWLHKARGGYGYTLQGTKTASGSPAERGIYTLDLGTGASRLIITEQQVIDFEYHPLFRQGTHWIEHLLINSDGSRFLFLHRFSTQDGAIYTRLMTADLNGGNLMCLINGMVSHYCWYTPTQILIWGRTRSFGSQVVIRTLLNKMPFGWVLQFLHRQRTGWMRQQVIGDRYMLLIDQSDQKKPVGVGVLEEDGHPTFSPDGQWMLADTYPDEEHYQALYLYNFKTGRRVDLGRFYSAPEFSKGIRCDLHPRWSRDGKQVCIDSVNNGTRQMYVLDVESIVGR